MVFLSDFATAKRKKNKVLSPQAMITLYTKELIAYPEQFK